MRFKILSLLLWCIAPSLASLQASPLRVGVLHFPPYYFCDGGDVTGGIYVELLQQVLPAAQIDYTLECFPPQRFYHNLGTGLNPLFVGIRGASELEGNVLYGDLILPGLELRAYTLDLSAELVTRKEQLHQRSVIVVKGFGYGGMLKYLQNPEHQVTLLTAPSHLAAFKMLRAQRGDWLLNYREPAETITKQVPLPNLRYGVLYHLDAAFILHRDYPEAQATLKRIEDAYLSLQQRATDAQ